MKHEIDLKNYEIRTDLIDFYLNNCIYNNNYKNINIKRYYNDSNKMNKGNYTVISYDDITDTDNYYNVCDVLIKELNYILKKNNINEKDSCLIVGLGNNESTPDSLGPKTIENVIVTNPIYELNELDEGFRRTYKIIPNVYANTGIETMEYIKSITNTINPDFIIIIDALASESTERINKTIQISDCGISPGSGVGNNRMELSNIFFWKKVIVIGIPTVVDASIIAFDTINYLYKNYAYNKKNLKNPKNRFILYNNITYNEEIDSISKENLFGIIGKLDNNELKQLVYEVLSPVGLNTMVTTKEIDFMIKKESELLGYAINKVLHKKYR